jgi:hypothetical protein
MKKVFNFLMVALFSMIVMSVAGPLPVLAIGGLAGAANHALKMGIITPVKGALFTSVDVSALAAYAGDYEKQLFSTMVNGLDIANDITVMPNIKHKKNLTKLTATANAKPFSTTEEYAGALKYAPRVLEVRPGKVELLIDLEEYRETWQAEQMGPGSGANKNNIPFAAYVWDQVFKSLGSEINDRTAYFGIDKDDAAAFDPGVAYAVGDIVTFESNSITHYYRANTATLAGESPATHPAKWDNVSAEAIAEGLGAKLEAEVTAANLSEVALGAVTTGAEALAAQRELFRSLSPKYKNMGVTLYQSFTDYELLMDGIEDKITKYTKDDNTPVYLPGTDRKCLVKPCTWLAGSRRLIASPKPNILMGTDLLSDMNDIKVLENAKLWTMPVGIKFLVGFQIRDLEAITIGDQS